MSLPFATVLIGFAILTASGAMALFNLIKGRIKWHTILSIEAVGGAMMILGALLI